MIFEIFCTILFSGLYGIFVFVYNVLYNPLFINYVCETDNYMLMFVPLYHKPIKNQYAPYQIVGFCSFIAPRCMIAIYLLRSYRKEGRFIDFLYTYKGYICTNNMKMLKMLKKHGYNQVDNIPYIRICYREV